MSDIIFLPSISDIASDHKQEIDIGRGVRSQNWHNATFRRVIHARVDQHIGVTIHDHKRADRFSLYDDEVSFHTGLYVLLMVRCPHFCINYQFFMHN